LADGNLRDPHIGPHDDGEPIFRRHNPRNAFRFVDQQIFRLHDRFGGRCACQADPDLDRAEIQALRPELTRRCRQIASRTRSAVRKSGCQRNRMLSSWKEPKFDLRAHDLAPFSIRAMVGTPSTTLAACPSHALPRAATAPLPDGIDLHVLQPVSGVINKYHRRRLSASPKGRHRDINGHPPPRKRRQLGRNPFTAAVFWFSASRHPDGTTPKRSSMPRMDSRVEGLNSACPRSPKGQRPSH